MSNEKYTGQNAGTQALHDFFADMSAGFAVQEQVADTNVEIIDLIETIELTEETLDEARASSLSYDRDVNGNKLLKVSSKAGSFTIQTNGNLPSLHKGDKVDYTPANIDAVLAHVNKHGTARHLNIFKSFYDGLPSHVKGEVKAVKNQVKAAAHKDVMAGLANKNELPEATYSEDFETFVLTEAQQKELEEVSKAHAEISDHSNRSKEELDLHAQMRRERDKRLAAMGVHQKRLVKEGEESTDTDLDEASKSKTGTYFVQALKGLMADGLEEKDHRDAATELLKYTAQSGIIKMDDVKKVAEKFGVGMGSGMFKENLDTTAPEWTAFAEAIDLNDDTKLQELFTFFKKEVKPVAAVDMGGDDVTEKWTPNIESMVFGKYSFMLWKNKTKSEWYGLAYNTRNGETKKTLESSTSKSAIIKQLKAMVTGHEPVTEEVEGVDVDPKTVVEGIIEKYQTAKTKSVDLVIEGLEQLIEYIAEETPPLEATSSDWSPEQETLVRGKNTLVMWKNKTKSEWYGYSYNTRTGELLVSITRKTKPEIVLDLRKFAVDLPVTD